VVSRKLPNLPRNRAAFSRTCGKTPRCHAVGDIGAVVLGVQGRLGGVREGQRREAASTEDIVSHLSCGFAEVWSCMRVGRSGCLHPAMPASVPPWVIPAGSAKTLPENPQVADERFLDGRGSATLSVSGCLPTLGRIGHPCDARRKQSPRFGVLRASARHAPGGESERGHVTCESDRRQDCLHR